MLEVWSFLLYIVMPFCSLCSKPKCRLLVTHDDYSMMFKLPKERTSLVTILRNPVDRVFSTYEFSVEVAARFLVHPNLTSATQMAKRLRSKARGVSTLDIWPWKYLVPWMREDLFARVCMYLKNCGLHFTWISIFCYGKIQIWFCGGIFLVLSHLYLLRHSEIYLLLHTPVGSWWNIISF